MKKLTALVLFGVIFAGFGADAAVSRGRTTPVASGAASGVVSRGRTSTGASGAVATPGAATTSARAARLNAGAGVKNTATPGASAAAAPKKVNARAASQKAINSGTKIAGATANTVVSEECKTKYYGCMDSFCMLDNANGGRCVCSNRHTELDKVLEEIQKLDEQSYAMATTGVERINMGDSADAVNAMVNDVTNSIKGGDTKTTKSRARSLNLDAWNTSYDDEDEEDSVFNELGEDISNLTGDALYSAVSSMCVKQIPECSGTTGMLKLMYSQQIKSDCAAYENSLKKQKNESAKKLQTAQTAMREAALEQHQNANKYDLGQCTIRFKQCMQTTGGCGDDFSKCATFVGTQNAQQKVGKKAKKTTEYNINTGITSVSIAATTYDTLMSKKPMCESVTKQCVAVKDKVWDAFLREAAPELKSAELIAESNTRMNCIGNISECFQKACKDNIDPNDPEGSYDMCLSRPQTMRSLCKVQIDPCEAAEPLILDYVYARLASMRVDACTKEVKSCLTDENRCGDDYSQCIGLDTDTIINMCPSEKLTACNTDSEGKTLKQADVYANIENIISGIMLNIDNSMLTICQNALNESMVKVCGDTESCDVTVDFSELEKGVTVQACVTTNGISVAKIAKNVETRQDFLGLERPSKKLADNALALKKMVNFDAFATQEKCYNSVSQIGSDTDIRDKAPIARLVGMPTFSGVSFDSESGTFVADDNSADKVLSILNSALSRTVNLIAADPKVQYCMTGRQVQGLGDKMIGRKDEKAARFPNLLEGKKAEIAKGLLENLSTASTKLVDKYAEPLAKVQNEITERIAAVNKLEKDKKAQQIDEANEKTCVETLGQNKAFERKMEPTENNCGDKLLSWDRLFTFTIGTYDPTTNECKLEMKEWKCIDWHKPVWCDNYCQKYDNGTVLSTRTVPMAKD